MCPVTSSLNGESSPERSLGLPPFRTITTKEAAMRRFQTSPPNTAHMSTFGEALYHQAHRRLDLPPPSQGPRKLSSVIPRIRDNPFTLADHAAKTKKVPAQFSSGDRESRESLPPLTRVPRRGGTVQGELAHPGFYDGHESPQGSALTAPTPPSPPPPPPDLGPIASVKKIEPLPSPGRSASYTPDKETYPDCVSAASPPGLQPRVGLGRFRPISTDLDECNNGSLRLHTSSSSSSTSSDSPVIQHPIPLSWPRNDFEWHARFLDLQAEMRQLRMDMLGEEESLRPPRREWRESKLGDAKMQCLWTRLEDGVDTAENTSLQGHCRGDDDEFVIEALTVVMRIRGREKPVVINAGTAPAENGSSGGGDGDGDEDEDEDVAVELE